MEWTVTRLDSSKILINSRGLMEEVAKGTRVLLMGATGVKIIVSWHELAIDEVEDNFIRNSNFAWYDTVTTDSGYMVKRYIDLETEESFFCVFSRK